VAVVRLHQFQHGAQACAGNEDRARPIVNQPSLHFELAARNSRFGEHRAAAQDRAAFRGGGEQKALAAPHLCFDPRFRLADVAVKCSARLRREFGGRDARGGE